MHAVFILPSGSYSIAEPRDGTKETKEAKDAHDA